MKNIALLLSVVLALSATSVRAEDAAPPRRARGFLSGLGLGLFVVGLAGAGAGLSGVFIANDANVKLNAFESPLPASEAEAFKFVLDRAAAGGTLTALGFIIGGLALAGGITCLAIDTPNTQAMVTFAPLSGGGTFVFSARF